MKIQQLMTRRLKKYENLACEVLADFHTFSFLCKKDFSCFPKFHDFSVPMTDLDLGFVITIQIGSEIHNCPNVLYSQNLKMSQSATFAKIQRSPMCTMYEVEGSEEEGLKHV